MKATQLTLFLLSILSVTVSCTGNRVGDADASKEPIVTVLDQTLYRSDLDGIVQYGMTPEDSIAVTQVYVKKWIDEILIYEKARKNTSNTKEIDNLVEEYRKSLIINDYQTVLLKERVSKAVSDQELMVFYETNKERFNLKENIIKGLYLKVPKESYQLDNFLKWYKLQNEASVANIEKNMLQNAIGYENFYTDWVSFNDVMDNIPEILTDSEDFLKRNTSLEARDSSFVYLLNIKEFKLVGTGAPFEFIKDQLRDAYIEEKRNTFIKELQTDLYNKALSNDDVKHYVK